MRTFNISKYRPAICSKFGDLLATSLTRLVAEAKASIYYTIKENQLLYCLKSSVSVISVII